MVCCCNAARDRACAQGSVAYMAWLYRLAIAELALLGKSLNKRPERFFPEERTNKVSWN